MQGTNHPAEKKYLTPSWTLWLCKVSVPEVQPSPETLAPQAQPHLKPLKYL